MLTSARWWSVVVAALLLGGWEYLSVTQGWSPPFFHLN